ncbi:MAG: LysR family transcriptional regulator [Lachnospiraceae bacterium]
MSTNFDYYKVFYYAASLGSITLAAKELFLSQPTVSRLIQNLENDLGITLFIRTKKGLLLTPEGNVLYQHVSKACQHIFAAESELNSLQAMDSGTIRLGASEMTIHNYLLPRFGRFHEKFPSIKFRIHSCNAAGAVTALKNGELDFAVVLSPIPAEDDFLIHPLASFQDIAAAGPAFSFLKDRLLDLKDLLAYPLICTERGTATREFWEQQFSLYGSALHTDIELPTTDLLCPMAAENLGLALVPEDFAAPFLKNSSLIKLELSCQIPTRQIFAIQNPQYPMSLAGQTFWELCTETSARLQEQSRLFEKTADL